MANESLEEFFDAAPHIEDEVSTELIKDTAKQIQKANSDLPDIADDLNLVKPEEVRENYDDARDALKLNLDVVRELMTQLSNTMLEVTPDPGKQNRLYESVGTLLKANADSAKALASLHQDAGSILGDSIKKVEIDNSTKEVKVSPEDMQDLIEAMRR